MRLVKALIVILILYLIPKVLIPFIGSKMEPGTWPVVPASVLKMYMFFIVTGVLLIFTFSEEGYEGVIGPIADIYANPNKGMLRLVTIVLVGAFGAFVTYQYVKPSFEAPVELRSIHPAPPGAAKVWGKSVKLQGLKNPLRDDKENFAKNVQEGGVVYFQNCYFCHGDRMLGRGPYYDGFNPMPLSFVDIGTIAQLTESFVFWRISTGGPGLPSEATPWTSAMPIWNTLLSEDQVWKVILFLYDYTGHHPRVTAGHE